MRITRVTVTLAPPANGRPGKLLASAVVTFDSCLTLYGVRVLSGPRGPWAALPERKKTGRCPACPNRPAFDAAWCSRCGLRLPTHQPDGQGAEARHEPVAVARGGLREEVGRAVVGAYERKAREAEREKERETAGQVAGVVGAA